MQDVTCPRRLSKSTPATVRARSSQTAAAAASGAARACADVTQRGRVMRHFVVTAASVTGTDGPPLGSEGGRALAHSVVAAGLQCRARCEAALVRDRPHGRPAERGEAGPRVLREP